jgi:hypothetical protein
LERDEIDELEEAMDGARSLLPVEVEKVVDVEYVEAMDSRDLSEELDDVYDEATELRPGPG